MTAFTDALVPAAGIHSHLMTNGGGCPTAFADALVPAAGIDSPLMTNGRRCLTAFTDALVPAAGIHSHLMTNGGGCPTAFANALVPVAECIMPRFGPRFLRNFRALGSAHYYSITCIVTSCNNKQTNTDELSSLLQLSTLLLDFGVWQSGFPSWMSTPTLHHLSKQSC